MVSVLPANFEAPGRPTGEFGLKYAHNVMHVMHAAAAAQPQPPPPPPPPPPQLGQVRYHHQQQRTGSAHLRSQVHARSQSMPEAVYLQQLQVAGGMAPHVIMEDPFPLPESVMMRSTHPGGHGHGLGHAHTQSSTQLRRSQTNAADFRRRQLHPHPHHRAAAVTPFLAAPSFHASTQYLPTSTSNWALDHDFLMMSAAARSRANIAALCPPPLAGGVPSPYCGSVATASRPLYQHRSLGYLSSPFPEPRSLRPAPTLSQSCQDFRQPLHVDCSVEYDLGHQPKIPKDSAPLLIIHPAYQQQHQQKRFHPYSSMPSSPVGMMEGPGVSASTPVKSRDLGYLTQSVPSKVSNSHHPYYHAPPPPPAPPGRSQHHLPPHQNRVSRHASFLVSSSTSAAPMAASQSTSSSSTLNGMSASLAAPQKRQLLHHHNRQQQQQQLLQAPNPPSRVFQFNQTMNANGAAAAEQQQHNPVPATAPTKPSNNKGKGRSPFDHAHKQQLTSTRGTGGVGEGGLHLSMPDITLGHYQQGSFLAQPNPRARVNLGPKLEASRKLSTESQDSGAGGSLGNSSQAKGPPANAPPVTSGLGPLASGANGGGSGANSQMLCDSGFGTPSSLVLEKEEEEERGNVGNNNSGNNVSKWKNSVTGLVTGFFCCSGVAAAAGIAPAIMASCQQTQTAMTENTPVAGSAPARPAVATTASATKRSVSHPPTFSLSPSSSSSSSLDRTLDMSSSWDSSVYPAGTLGSLSPPVVKQQRSSRLSFPTTPKEDVNEDEDSGHDIVEISSQSGFAPLDSGSWTSATAATASTSHNSNYKNKASSSSSSVSNESPLAFKWPAATGAPANASAVANSSSSYSVRRQLMASPTNGAGRVAMTSANGDRYCPTCYSGYDDCRDGFCISVWNKENLMRPIHI